MKNLILGESILSDISVNILAYQLECENPHLSFFEINQLVKAILDKKKATVLKPYLKIVE
jgi:hypothetical protein